MPARHRDTTAAAAFNLGMSERLLQDSIIEYAQDLGWEYQHTHTSTFSPKGLPDLILARPLGPQEDAPVRLVVSELKSENGPIDPEQTHWLDLFRRVSVIEVYLWRPRDWFDEGPSGVCSILR